MPSIGILDATRSSPSPTTTRHVDFTGIDGAAVVHVLARDIGAVDSIAAHLPPGLAVRTWHDLATFYVQANSMFSGFLGVIRAIILLVTLFIMANTMNRIVRERMREWGTLRAMGMRKRSILLLVVLEGCFQGIVGAAIGILLGFGSLGASQPAGRRSGAVRGGGQRVVVKILLSGQSIWLNLIPAGLFAGRGRIPSRSSGRASHAVRMPAADIGGQSWLIL